MSRTVPVEVRSGQHGQHGQQLPRLDLDAADDFHRGFFSEPSRHSRFSADEGMCLWNLQPKLLLKDFITWNSRLDNGGKWFSLISCRPGYARIFLTDGFPKKIAALKIRHLFDTLLCSPANCHLQLESESLCGTGFCLSNEVGLPFFAVCILSIY